MTTEEIIALAKEKLGKEITEQEAQDYLSGKTPLPDEALELVDGGVTFIEAMKNSFCIVKTEKFICKKCKADSRYEYAKGLGIYRCKYCGDITTKDGQPATLPPGYILPPEDRR